MHDFHLLGQRLAAPSILTSLCPEGACCIDHRGSLVFPCCCIWFAQLANIIRPFLISNSVSFCIPALHNGCKKGGVTQTKGEEDPRQVCSGVQRNQCLKNSWWTHGLDQEHSGSKRGAEAPAVKQVFAQSRE